MAGLQDLVRSRIEGAAGIQRALEATAPKIVAVAGAMIRSLRTGGKIVFFGNGGSAADAQHIAGELVGRYYLDRRPLSAMALTTPPWTNPCCCSIAGLGLTVISTMPGETLPSVAPSVVINPCLAKLVLMRPCNSSGAI